MRFLLDTNILLPLEDPEHVLTASLARFVGLARENGHLLVYHRASEADLLRDTNAERRNRNLDWIKEYTRLEDRARCPWNNAYTRPEDAVDNELLYALYSDDVHALVTEDRSLYDKARDRGLGDRVCSIQTAEDWLCRLHEAKTMRLPEIEDVSLDTLMSQQGADRFQDLREAHPEFDQWLSDNAHAGRRAWIVRERSGLPRGVCVYARREDAIMGPEGTKRDGPTLELCAFTVSPAARGSKIGEMLLGAAFRYATANRLEHIVVHLDADEHHLLVSLFEDFGFTRLGGHPGSTDRKVVYCRAHPLLPPENPLEPLEYLRRFFPHFRHDSEITAFIVSLRPGVHRLLFPDYCPPSGRQLSLFSNPNVPANGIKLAYLCHAQIGRIKPGDVVLFYRSGDERAITSVGVVESYETSNDADRIAARLERRTVYSMKEIERMATKPTRVLLFRLVRHFQHPLPQSWLEGNGILRGAPHRIARLSDDALARVLAAGG